MRLEEFKLNNEPMLLTTLDFTNFWDSFTGIGAGEALMIAHGLLIDCSWTVQGEVWRLLKEETMKAQRKGHVL